MQAGIEFQRLHLIRDRLQLNSFPPKPLSGAAFSLFIQLDLKQKYFAGNKKPINLSALLKQLNTIL